jgi:hypothetical protein
MPVRFLRFFLITAVGLVLLGCSIGLVAVTRAASSGHAATTTVPLRIDPATTSVVLDRSGHPVGKLIFDKATLSAEAGGAGYAMLQAVDILIVGGLWVAVLLLTLKLVGQIASGSPFDGLAVRRLRTIGWSLIALTAWSWTRALALPPVLLSFLNPVSGEYRLLPAIASGMAGLQNARVEATLGVGFLAAGLLALILAQAFRIGLDLREDNESIL